MQVMPYPGRANTDWFAAAGWGTFTHFLVDPAMTADAWNRQVDAVEVDVLAEQIASTGSKYHFMTIGQNSGHFCAPNAAYDEFTGIHPSKCSQRDLIADLAQALQRHGVAPMVYIPSGAPSQDAIAIERLEWEWGFGKPWPDGWEDGRTGKRLAAFQQKWEAILATWSLTWGTNVAGWWVDGCYFSDEMYRHADTPNFQSFAAAMKAGNPQSLVAFNPGVLTPVISLTEYEDYTAGEISDAFPVCPGRWVEGAQYHILSYLGNTWCGRELRFPDAFVRGYTQDVLRKGGVVTWDVPITPEGTIPAPFLAQLSTLRDLSGAIAGVAE